MTRTSSMPSDWYYSFPWSEHFIFFRKIALFIYSVFVLKRVDLMVPVPWSVYEPISRNLFEHIAILLIIILSMSSFREQCNLLPESIVVVVVVAHRCDEPNWLVSSSGWSRTMWDDEHRDVVYVSTELHTRRSETVQCKSSRRSWLHCVR